MFSPPLITRLLLDNTIAPSIARISMMLAALRMSAPMPKITLSWASKVIVPVSVIRSTFKVRSCSSPAASRRTFPLPFATIAMPSGSPSLAIMLPSSVRIRMLPLPVVTMSLVTTSASGTNSPVLRTRFIFAVTKSRNRSSSSTMLMPPEPVFAASVLIAVSIGFSTLPRPVPATALKPDALTSI